MIYLPVCFFSIFLAYQYKKFGISIGFYIIALYVMISIFTVIMDKMGLIYPDRRNINVITGVVYCGLLFLIIYPFCDSKINCIEKIFVSNPKITDGLTFFFFGYFLFTLIAYWDDLVWILSFGDFGELRKMITEGDSLVSTKFSGFINVIVTILNVFGSISFIMFPVFFINICFLKRSWWHNIMSFLGTTTVIITGILGCDRSSTFRWFLLLVANVVFFWKYLDNWSKAKILPIIITVCLLAGGYMFSVTSDRFSDTSSGTEGGVVSYGGQSYINFCYMFDHFDNREGFSTYYFLPAVHKWILKDYQGNVPRQQELTARTGIECGIFYTVLGNFILDGNSFGPFVFVGLFLVLCSYCKKNIRGPSVSFNTFILLYSLMVIPIFGIIAYPYVTGYHTLSLGVLFCLLHIYNRPII